MNSSSVSRLKTWGYPALLVLLLGAFVIQPWALRSAGGERVVRFLYPAVLFASLVVVSDSRKVVIVGLLTLIPSLTSTVLEAPTAPGQVAANLFGSVFLLIVISAILRDVLIVRTSVTMPSVFGALNVYLLLGLLWTLMFNAADGLLDGAFHGLSPDGPIRGAQLFYFSFVTLTTLGYGDVTPAVPETMSLAAVEAIVGQLYLVVLVAALVSGLVASRGRGRTPAA